MARKAKRLKKPRTLGEFYARHRCRVHPECSLADGHRPPCVRLDASAKRDAAQRARGTSGTWPAAWFPKVAQNDPELLEQLKKK